MLNLFLKSSKDFVSALGIFWLLLKLLDFFFREKLMWLNSDSTFLVVSLSSSAYTIFTNWPWKKIRCRILGTDAHICIKYGDLFKTEGHLVIPTNNFFNTDLSIISHQSLLGQFIDCYYSGDSSIVTQKVQESLLHLPKGQRIRVTRGNNTSYPVGTTISFIGPNNRRIFMIATTEVKYQDEREIIHSEPKYLLNALENLWKKVEITNDDQVLCMPSIGAGISHSTKRTYDSIILIAQSFVNKVKDKRPCSELIICIRKKDLNLYEFEELRNGLRFIAK